MGVKKYSKEVIREGKRVRWPKPDQFFPVLIAVLIICVFTALVLSLEDWAAGSLIGQVKEWLKGLGGNSSSSSSTSTSSAIQIIRSLR